MTPSPGVDFGTLVSRLQAQSAISSAEAQARINQAYRRMAAESYAIREKVAIGDTVVGTSVYDIPADVVQIISLRVNGLRYERKSSEEIDDLAESEAYVVGYPARFYSPEFTSSGTSQVYIWPSPTTVVPITARAAVLPADMTDTTEGGEYPKLPIDFHEDLVDGALATVLLRDDERLSDSFALEDRFQQRIAELRGRVTSRVGGGVARIKLTR